MKKYNLFLGMLIALLSFTACNEPMDDVLDDGKGYSEDASFGLSGGISDGSGGVNGDGGDAQIVAGQITAGEWNDLEHWDFWLNLGQDSTFNKMPGYWDFNLNNRISVVVKNTSGELLPMQKLELLTLSDELIWETKSDHEGRAELWPGSRALDEVKLRIGSTIINELQAYPSGIIEATLNISAPAKMNKIDIAFVVDATGSMGDELRYLKVELVDVIDSVKETNTAAIINTSSVFYRDEGDDYVTRKSDFTSDVNTTMNFIKAQSASGGGDFPEAVHSALKVAIDDLQWSTDANSKILFLLLDAPPHHEEQIISEIHQIVIKANQNGIKIIPIVASGINKETEFLMRYLSIASNGSYVFITNHSGIGGDHLEATVGEYEVEYLNHLMVRLINKYLE